MSERGFCIWFTGLPSAGKTTLAQLLAGELRRLGRRTEVLDGDEIRQRLTRGFGFSRQDRDESIRRIVFVAKLLARNGLIVITAAISPYRVLRREAREEIGAFVEIYVKCPLEVCISRDVKGLYRRALSGEIQNFTGVTDPYEEPLAPELTVETDRLTPEACLASLTTMLHQLGYLSEHTEGMTRVAVPSYLIQTVEARLDGRIGEVWGYTAQAIDRALLEDGEDSTLTASEQATIESRLKSLGYLD